MLDQLEVLKLVAARLDAARIPYIVTGSTAASHYGQPRMTRDIDVVAAIHPHEAARFPDILGPDFVCDAETVRDAVAQGRMFNVVHRSMLQKVDFVVRTDADFELEKFHRRRRVDIDGQGVWMIAPEDLILSKLVWNKDHPSDLQARDVRGIVALQPSLDWTYLDRWALRLTVAHALREFRP